MTAFRVGDRVVPLNSAPCDACFFCLHGQQNLCDDLLFNNGAYAEYLLVPARIVEKNTLPLPDAMAFERAALTEPLACVMRGLEESGATSGQTAVVLGAGPIGLLFIHAASLAGLRVIAVVKRKDQVDTARRLGASDVVRLAEVDDPVAAVRGFTPQGRGADVVFEAVATPEAWQWAVGMARKGGVVNLFGGPPAGTTVSLDTNLIHYSDLTLKASFHHTPATARQAFQWLCDERFDAEAFLTGEADLDSVPAVFARMLDRPAEGTRARHQDSGSSVARRGTSRYHMPPRSWKASPYEPCWTSHGSVDEHRRRSVCRISQGVSKALRRYMSRQPYAPAPRLRSPGASAWPPRITRTSTLPASFLPQRLRAHFFSIYAFCRTSDDLGDEVADTALATHLLGEVARDAA